jgi:hypothetical protein
MSEVGGKKPHCVDWWHIWEPHRIGWGGQVVIVCKRCGARADEQEA